MCGLYAFDFDPLTSESRPSDLIGPLVWWCVIPTRRKLEREGSGVVGLNVDFEAPFSLHGDRTCAPIANSMGAQL